MKLSTRTSLLAGLLGFAALAAPAQAQLTLSGKAYGTFADELLPNTTVTNSTTTSVFSSGIPYQPSDTPTSITYNGNTFTDVGDGGAIALGILNFKNGVTLLDSTATTASLDLFLDLSPVGGPAALKLTTMSFNLLNTPNNPIGDVPDLYSLSYTEPAVVWLENAKITFSLVFTDGAFLTPAGKPISENGEITTGDIFAHIEITPIPEPSTYAFAGVAVLGIVALLRRRRNPLAA